MQVTPQDVDISLAEPKEDVYEVERILRWRKRKVKNKIIREFLVLWVGYPLEESTWDPEENFTDRQLV